MALSSAEVAQLNSSIPFTLFTEPELTHVVGLATASRNVAKHMAETWRSVARAKAEYAKKIRDIVASSEAAFPADGSAAAGNDAIFEEMTSLGSAFFAVRAALARTADEHSRAADALAANVVAPLAAFVDANAAKALAAAARKAAAKLQPARDALAKDERKLAKTHAAAAKATAAFRAATEPDKRSRFQAQARELERDAALLRSALDQARRAAAADEADFAAGELPTLLSAFQDLQAERDALVRDALTAAVVASNALVPFLQETNWQLLETIGECQPMADIRAFVLRNHVAVGRELDPAQVAKARALEQRAAEEAEAAARAAQEAAEAEAAAARRAARRAAAAESRRRPVIDFDAASDSSAPPLSDAQDGLFGGLDDEPTVALGTGGGGENLFTLAGRPEPGDNAAAEAEAEAEAAAEAEAKAKAEAEAKAAAAAEAEAAAAAEAEAAAAAEAEAAAAAAAEAEAAAAAEAEAAAAAARAAAKEAKRKARRSKGAPRVSTDALFGGLDDEPTLFGGKGGSGARLDDDSPLFGGADTAAGDGALFADTAADNDAAAVDVVDDDDDGATAIFGEPELGPGDSTEVPTPDEGETREVAGTETGRNLFADTESDDEFGALADGADVFGEAAAAVTAAAPPGRRQEADDDVFAAASPPRSAPIPVGGSGAGGDDDFLALFSSATPPKSAPTVTDVASSPVPGFASAVPESRGGDDDAAAAGGGDEMDVLAAMLAAEPTKRKGRSNKGGRRGSGTGESSGARKGGRGAGASGGGDDGVGARKLAAVQEMAAENDYYGMMGVSPKASDAALAARFAQLQDELDPLRFDSRRDQRRASSHFQKINAAYVSVLAHKKKRAVYNTIVKLRSSYASLATPSATPSAVRKALKAINKAIAAASAAKMPTTLSAELSMAVRMVLDLHGDAVMK